MHGTVENTVGEVAVLQDRKQSLGGARFGTAGRLLLQGEVSRDLQLLRGVQSRPVKDDGRVPARRHRLADVPEMAVPVPVQAAEKSCTYP